MDLEMGSDDDLFLEERERPVVKHQTWSPKHCEPKWMFNEELVTLNPDASSTEHAQILSYQADLLYARKQFTDALVIYRKGVIIVPMRFVLLRRSFLEGAARCCTYLKDHSEALQFASMLMAESLTIDQRMLAHSLLTFVYAAAGNHSDAIKNVQICIEWQRSNPHFWMKLAESYKALQSQHALDQVQTEHAQNRPADSEFTNYTENLTAQKLGNRNHCDSSVNWCTQAKDGSSDCDAKLSFAPKEPFVENHANNDKDVQQCESTKTADCSCQQGGVSVSELRQMPSGSTTATELLELPNVIENERFCSGTCSSSIGSLLDKLDVLAITDRDASTKSRNDDALRELSCVECRPKLLTASCLLRTRLLLKSVEHSVGSFAKVKNGQLQREIEQLLADLELGHDVLGVLHHHARVVFRKGCHRTEGTSTRDDKDSETNEETTLALGERDSSREEFEAKWFSWLSSAWYS